jgi:K+-sensing histidine kinase KdpD
MVQPPAERGALRVYLGAAPGSGKTFAMLREGQARRAQGEDVVIGFVESYGRPRTVEALGRLEAVPRLRVCYRGTSLEEMDLDALLARRPQVALVDELAHTNAPGVRNAKRWQDVETLRDAGIDVVTTLNVQHVESVKDLVEGITGISVRETVPDRVLDGADEIQFIDIAPEALRKRMRHGNVYAPDKIDTALRNFFRPGNLGALREIALRLVAQRMETTRATVRPAPEEVLVAVSGGGSSEALIRRGARLARRTGGSCTVMTARGLRRRVADAQVAALARIAEQVGAGFVERNSDDVVSVVVEVARELYAQHVVIGESPPRAILGGWRATLADRVVEALPGVDVHVLARFAPEAMRAPPTDRPVPDELLRRLGAAHARGGALRIYLGYARGCGTTTAMLDEARRRTSRGTDVAVAGGGRLHVDALLARNPQVACVDDLARLDTGGAALTAVLQRLLAARITVIATLHLTDLRSTVETMGPLLGYDGAHPRLDDAVLAMADEIELVDATPALLLERLRRGNILPPAEVARALQTEFRAQVLEMLRETAFRVIAQHTDRRLLAYMHERGIEQPWEVRPRVLACVPPRPGMERLVRTAATLAERIDGDFQAVTVRTRARSDGEKLLLGGYAALTHQLDGEFVTLRHGSAAAALAGYAREALVTEMVVYRGRRRRPWRRSTLRSLIRMVKDVDVHVLSLTAMHDGRHRESRS